MFRFHAAHGYNIGAPLSRPQLVEGVLELTFRPLLPYAAWIAAGAFSMGINLFCVFLPTPKQ